MKILYVHPVSAWSRVTGELLGRLRLLREVHDVEVAVAGPGTAARALAAVAPVHVEPDPKKLARLAIARRIDLVVAVDAGHYLAAMRELSGAPPNALRIAVEIAHGDEVELAALEAAPETTGVIVPSDAAARFIVERYGVDPSRASIVPHVIDPAIFHAAPAVEAGPPIVLWTGELDARDDWPAFLEIAALAALEGAPFEVWMVGGEAAPEPIHVALLETAASLGLQARFKWIAHVDHAAMGSLYRGVRARGGVLVTTAPSPAFGTTILEALASGCPVIARDAPALAELAVEGPHFARFDSGDVERAAVLVGRALGPARRVIERALDLDRPRIVERFAAAAIGPRLTDAIAKIASSPRS